MNRPNILFLLSDEHSFRLMNHLGAEHGAEPVPTPSFDALAASGTVMRHAYCQMPLCTPSRLCLLTGREAQQAGAWDNGAVLRPELPTLPATLRDAGYATALIGKMHLGGKQQFVGFQERPYGDLTGKCGHQWEPVPRAERGMRARTATAVGVTGIPESLLQDQVVAQETAAWVREQAAGQPDQPWFAMASFSRPHFPLTAPKRHLDRFWPHGVTPPKAPAAGDAWDHPMSVGMRQGFQTEAISEEERQFARASYFACVTYLDEVIGDLLARLERDGLLDNTIIVYTSDHGELAGEHGVWWKHSWHEASARVPLIISRPEQRRGDAPAAVVDTAVGLVDLFPTLCGLAGVETPDGLVGQDLAPALEEDKEPPARPIVTDNLVPRWGEGTEFRMVRQGNYKYVRFRHAPPLAFDLAADLNEQQNLLAQPEADWPAMVRELKEFAETSIDFDAAEHDRTVRDGDLAKTFAHGITMKTLNLYTMPDGRLVNADTPIYAPEEVAPSAAAVFGEDYREQNRRV